MSRPDELDTELPTVPWYRPPAPRGEGPVTGSTLRSPGERREERVRRIIRTE